ncbi:MAG: hypothetical protein PGN30_10290 [Mycolicibacterium neoaurum]|uniref:hypothetical protein n=1 Tax=Mycolicibacterium neoaurum TaxID=1795 RepID=UPI002FFB658D
MNNPDWIPETWAEYQWPEWVPTQVRSQIESFWSAAAGRGPHAWLNDARIQGGPPFGATVTLGDGFTSNPTKVTGRFVHAWNNIGRLVMNDGTFRYTSFSRKWAEQQPDDKAAR